MAKHCGSRFCNSLSKIGYCSLPFLILLQLIRISRAAQRSARHVAETKEQFAEINERVGIMLDRMVDAEERLLRMREIVDEAEQIQATTSGDDDTGTAPS